MDTGLIELFAGCLSRLPSVRSQTAKRAEPRLGRRHAIPAQLSRELPHGSGPFLDRRPRIHAGALAASGSMGLIAIYQMGILRHIPEPPLPRLDADRVDPSEEVYEELQSLEPSSDVPATP